MYEEIYKEMDDVFDNAAKCRQNNLMRLENIISEEPINLLNMPIPSDVAIGYALTCTDILPKKLQEIHDNILNDIKKVPRYSSTNSSSFKQAFFDYSLIENLNDEQIKYLAGIKKMCNNNH